LNIIKLKINEVLKEIQQRNHYPTKVLDEDVKIVNGLGFSSLDVAELVAVLEIELGVDPFSAGVSIMSVQSIGDLYRVYEEQTNLVSESGS
jgi:acyl carrier protein